MSSPKSSDCFECPVCGAKDVTLPKLDRQPMIAQCRQCGLRMRHPMESRCPVPTPEPIEDAASDHRTAVREVQAKRLAAQRLREIRRELPLQGDWLDVGSTNSAFVDLLSNSGISATRMALRAQRNELRDRMGSFSRPGSESLDDRIVHRLYDVVTAFNVFETCDNPANLMDHLTLRVRPGGFLVMTMANRRALPQRLRGSKSYFASLPARNFYFDNRTVRRLGTRFGFVHRCAHWSLHPVSLDDMPDDPAIVPRIFVGAFSLVRRIAPKSIRQWPFSMYLGEMMWIGQKPGVEEMSFESALALQPQAV